MKLYNNIKLHIAVPYEEQTTERSEENRDRYFEVHEFADSIELINTHYHPDCFYETEKYMAHKSDVLLLIGKQDSCSKLFHYAENNNKVNKEYLEVWDGIEACIVTNHVADGGEIAYMHHEESGDSYNGWVFYGFDEDEEYWDNTENFCLYSTHKLAERFLNIIPLLHSPIGTAFFGNKDGTFELDDREE